ncbi:hypothetical protein ACQEVX_30430 [Streptomyces syringium]|uniref:hypothetical protein n=1 Tax=Streptomyces syringium TaxID=76729 RepID=UPI003D8C797E
MAKLPTDAVLVSLFHLGVSDAEIAEQYGVKPQAVNKRFMRMDPPLRRKSIPAVRAQELVTSLWDVKVIRTGPGSHHNSYGVRYLKVWVRLQLGDTTSPKQQKGAVAFIRRLIRDDVVLDYDRDSVEGWKFVPRMPSDGRWIIRWPAGKELPEADLQRALELPGDEEELEVLDQGGRPKRP